MRVIVFATLAALAACGQSGPPAGSQDSRAHDIISRLPLIDACLALSPGARVVTINPAASLSVRLSGDAGDFDCVVPNDSADLSNATILPALDAPPADAILFVRGPGENPGGECYEAPEVHDANGALLGWVLDPEGC